MIIESNLSMLPGDLCEGTMCYNIGKKILQFEVILHKDSDGEFLTWSDVTEIKKSK